MITSVVGEMAPRTRVSLQQVAADANSPAMATSVLEFPEGRFLPPPDLAREYRQRVRRGYYRMRQRRVILCGLARDTAEFLPLTIARMERLGGYFADYRVIIYENDSQDHTLDLLQRWAHRNWRVTVLNETRQDPLNLPCRCPRRGGRMAYYRNRYRDHVESSYRDFDDVLVADTDLAGGWSYDGIAHSYSYHTWDFMGSFGVIYRRRGWDPNCIYQFDAWAFRRDDDYQALATKEVNHMRWLRGQPLVPVTSCFGGLGLYRLAAFLAGRYAGGDCEHIGLHRSMRANGFPHIYLNPSQIVLYGRKRRRMDRWVSLLQNVVAQSCLIQAPAWL
ncbi:MAG: glycosyltransferase family A protein [Thermoguttaceae bacterium]